MPEQRMCGHCFINTWENRGGSSRITQQDITEYQFVCTRTQRRSGFGKNETGKPAAEAPSRDWPCVSAAAVSFFMHSATKACEAVHSMSSDVFIPSRKKGRYVHHRPSFLCGFPVICCGDAGKRSGFQGSLLWRNKEKWHKRCNLCSNLLFWGQKVHQQWPEVSTKVGKQAFDCFKSLNKDEASHMMSSSLHDLQHLTTALRSKHPPHRSKRLLVFLFSWSWTVNFSLQFFNFLPAALIVEGFIFKCFESSNRCYFFSIGHELQSQHDKRDTSQSFTC